MDAEYVAQYRDLYERHWWWRAREAFVLDAVGDVLPGRTNAQILDVGCGDGLLFDELERFGRVEGVEPDPLALSAGGRWAQRIARQPFDDSFAPGKRYSAVLFLDVLEHVADPLPMLRHALDLLDEDGSIVVTVPAHHALWTTHDVLNDHVRRYSKASLEDVVRGAEGRVVRMSYFFHWLAPVKLGVRVKEAVVPSAPRRPTVPPRWLNGMLEGLSRVEQRTVTRLPMPFGASLLAVVTRGEAP